MYRENVRHLLKGVDGNVVVATAVTVVARYEVPERAPVLPARRLVTGQAGRPRPVDDVNDGRELPPNHTDDETPSSRRNSNALSRRWASSSSLRRSLNRPSSYPQNADPPACQTSPRRRAAGRRNTPPSAGHGRGRDLQDDLLPGDRNRPHDAAPVRVRRRGLGLSYVLASLCRLPRGRLVLLLVRARIAGVADD